MHWFESILKKLVGGLKLNYQGKPYPNFMQS